MLGAILTTSGAGLTIIGGIILFKNAPPDVGGNNVLMIPSYDGEDGLERETGEIQSRANWNQRGFVLLTIGAVLQLAGYWADKLFP